VAGCGWPELACAAHAQTTSREAAEGGERKENLNR